MAVDIWTGYTTWIHSAEIIGVRCVCYRDKETIHPASWVNQPASELSQPDPRVNGAARCQIGGSEVRGEWPSGRTGQILHKYLSGTGVHPGKQEVTGGRCVTNRTQKKLSLERTTCLADKTNHPVERLSLNRSQCGSCSTKYNTMTGT